MKEVEFLIKISILETWMLFYTRLRGGYSKIARQINHSWYSNTMHLAQK